VRVDWDAVRVRLHADALQADPADARTPAGGDEQLLAAQLAPVVELEHVLLALALAPRRARVRREDQLDAFVAKHFAERLAQRSRLAREQVVGHVDYDRLAAEPAHGLTHLHADRAAAEDQEPPRHSRHRRHLAVAPDALQLAQSRHRRHYRVGPVREHHVIGCVAHAVDLDRARSREPTAAAQQIDAVIGQPFRRPLVGVVGDHEVAPRERRLDVDLGARRRLARAVHRLARAQQRLRRDAGPVGALSSHELALDHRYAQATLRERPRAVLARGARAEHDHVVVAHLGSSSPARSRTMKSAYQSGQFSSASPVRSSCLPCAAAARRSASARSSTDS
jgi:hypothetical protein